MKSFQKKQGTWLAAILIIGVFYAYKTFFSSSDTAGLTAQDTGNDVVSLYQSLQNVTLDQSLFTSSGYKTLVDFSPVLNKQPVGRSHPFDPLGK